MMRRIRISLFVTAATVLTAASPASAQVIGTFRWRPEPYCNVLTLTVTQNGVVFMLSGFDEPCGGPRLPVQGIGVLQNDGSVTLGLTVISVPGGAPVNLEANLSLATVSGTWRDGVGNSGPFRFNPSGTSGGPRPLQFAAGPPGPQGAQGSPGPTGPQGMRGPQGPAGVSQYEIVSTPSAVPAGRFGNVFVTCPNGKNVISAGHITDTSNLVIIDSYPGDSGRTWIAYFQNIGDVVRSIEVRVICAVVQ